MVRSSAKVSAAFRPVKNHNSNKLSAVFDHAQKPHIYLHRHGGFRHVQQASQTARYDLLEMPSISEMLETQVSIMNKVKRSEAPKPTGARGTKVRKTLCVEKRRRALARGRLSQKNQKKPTKKEKAIGTLGSISGITSVLGSWQVCHSVCLGIISLLSFFGIVVAGMPLLFLTTIAKPIWIAAAVILAITFIIAIKKKCISHTLLTINTGLVFAGIPFGREKFEIMFLVIGGIIVLIGVLLFIQKKISQRSSGEK